MAFGGFRRLPRSDFLLHLYMKTGQPVATLLVQQLLEVWRLIVVGGHCSQMSVVEAGLDPGIKAGRSAFALLQRANGGDKLCDALRLGSAHGFR